MGTECNCHLSTVTLLPHIKQHWCLDELRWFCLLAVHRCRRLLSPLSSLEGPQHEETHQSEPLLPHHLPDHDRFHHHPAHGRQAGRNGHRLGDDSDGCSCLLGLHPLEEQTRLDQESHSGFHKLVAKTAGCSTSGQGGLVNYVTINI